MSNLTTYQVHRDLTYPLLYMQRRGICMDRVGLKRESDKQTKIIADKKLELNELCGRELNEKFSNSPKQVMEYFYNEKGVPPYKEKGKRTANEKALIRIARKGFPEAFTILAIRQAQKLKSTYLEVTLGVDGRLRSSMNPVGAKTGRLSSSANIFGEGTNIQTIPHDILKFLLADDGYIIYNVDKAQAENRIVAYIAPDRNMIDAFENGIDIHAQTAGIIFNKLTSEVSNVDGSSMLGNGTHSERYFGKQANHSLNYLLGVKAFALRLQIPEKQAAFIIAKYFSGYPGVRTYHNWVLQRCQSRERNHTLVNSFGRQYQFYERIERKNLREAVPIIPQSTVADIINRWGLLEVWDNPVYEGLELLNQVHDSVVFQIPKKLGVDRHFDIVSKLCQSLDKPLTWQGTNFVIPTDVSMGHNLGGAYGDNADEGQNEVKEMNFECFAETFQKFST